jgi:hypothetical protein
MSFSRAMRSISSPFGVPVLEQPVADVLPHCERIEQRSVLEHHADLLANAVELVGVGLHHAHAIDLDVAAIRADQSEDEAEGRALSDSRGPEDDPRRALRHVEREVLQDHPAADAVVDLVEADHGRLTSAGSRTARASG